MGSFSIWHWLIVLLVVVLIFGTKKLRNIGQDLGGAVKGFKKHEDRRTARRLRQGSPSLRRSPGAPIEGGGQKESTTRT